MRAAIIGVALLCCLAHDASAQNTPVIRYTWGGAAVLTRNQDFAGPGTYTQTISFTGVSGPVRYISIYIATGPCWGRPDAWAMICDWSALGLDCAGNAGAFTWSDSAAGCARIPNLTLQVSFGPAVTRPPGFIVIEARMDPPLEADPATRYGLVTLTFDHSNSIAGPSDGVHCGGADLPFCLGLEWAQVFDASYQPIPAALEALALSWQDPDGAVDCYGAVPTRPSSWGRLKTFYR